MIRIDGLVMAKSTNINQFALVIIQGDSYSIIQTLTGGRFQLLDTLSKMFRFYVKIVEDKAC
jgi:hypothetical protein